MRILIGVTHLLGAGHLTRAAALARAFSAAGHDTVLVSGGMPAPLVRVGAARLVQLPPVRIEGFAFGRLIGAEGQDADAPLFEARRRALLDALAEAAPDVVLTELFPFGRRNLAPEFLALVEAARARPERPLILASVRDILVPPDRAAKVAEAHARLTAHYDGVLVHGDPRVAPLDASWPVDDTLATAIRYTGYVDEGDPAPAPGPRSGVLVAAGSSRAGIGLFETAIAAARRRPDLSWRILVGHGVPEAELTCLAEGLPAGTVMRARPDYRDLLAGAAVSVSQCGYNTAVDLMVTGTPAVLVPFEAGRETEQRLRAERLVGLGRARIVPEAGLTPQALIAAVEDAAGATASPLAHAIALDGGARTVALVEEMRRERSAPSPRRREPLRPTPYPGPYPESLTGQSVSPTNPPHSGARRSRLEGGLQGSQRVLEASFEARQGGHLRMRAGVGLERTSWPDPEGPASPHLGMRSSVESVDRLSPLRDALDRAGDTGRRVDLWWRDDDAIAATPALDRLLALKPGAPILIAAIPSRVEASLGQRLAEAPGVSLAVHGLAHDNHAPPGAKAAEFGPHRPLASMRREAAMALRIARDRLPGEKLLPVFVPPWNRLADDLARDLPGLGYRGLSAAGGPAIAGLTRAEATLDVIDWRGSRSLRDPAALIGTLLAHAGAAASDPLGLLTHHLAHDEAVWEFLGQLLPLLAGHPAVRLRDPKLLFLSTVDAPSGGPISGNPERPRAV